MGFKLDRVHVWSGEVADQAGGVATDGRGRILEVTPTSLHQRTPLLVGSREEMGLLMGMLREDADARG